MALKKIKDPIEKPGNYLKDLQEKLVRHQQRLTQNQTRILLVHPTDPEFDRLVNDRNSITADIQITKDRIAKHNRPGIISQVQFLK